MRPKTQHGSCNESLPTSSQTSVIRISPHTIQPKSSIAVNSQSLACWRGVVSSPQQQLKHTNPSTIQWQTERHPSVVVSSQHGHILEKALTTIEIVSVLLCTFIFSYLCVKLS